MEKCSMFMGKATLPRCKFFWPWSTHFNAISIKIPANHFMDIDNLTLKFIWRIYIKFIWGCKRYTRIVSAILLEKNKVRGLMLPNFKTYYTAKISKTVWYWWKSRQIDEWKRISSLAIDSNKYSKLIYDKLEKIIQ